MADKNREVWFHERPGSLIYVRPVHWKAFALYAVAALLFIVSGVVMDKLGLLHSNFALILIPLVIVFLGVLIIAGLHTAKLEDNR